MAEIKQNKLVQGVSLTSLLTANSYKSSIEVCPGCENHCTVKAFRFQNGNTYYSGNNCEKVYAPVSAQADEKPYKGVNMFAEKYKLLFGRKASDIKPLGKTKGKEICIGIPRGLGIYENYPFWHALFAACGLKTVLSKPSTNAVYVSGARTVMADNICFPAKLMHGHVNDLVEKKVDRIFYPYVVFERKEDAGSSNSFNCPIVTGYSDVLKSAMDTAANHHIPFDAPVITFNDTDLLYCSCTAYLQTLGVSKSITKQAIALAVEAQDSYLQTLTDRAMEVLKTAKREKRMVILLAGRPYHIDPLIEHKIAQSISDMGIDLITENVAVQAGSDVYRELSAVSQWAYPNHIFKAAHFVANSNAADNLHFVELTSFGCGPDAFILDEVNSILRHKGKNLTVLKIDDVNNIGSLRLRIRSLVESLKMVQPAAIEQPASAVQSRITTKIFEQTDRRRTLLAPYFAEGYSEFLPSVFKLAGYHLVNLPMGNQIDADTGLKFANNEICYPATIVVGSIMNALQSGKYDLDNTAVIITQTGGQCRASNYYSLIKNAMVSAGFQNVPVISLATGTGVSNNQPGFEIDWIKIANMLIYIMLYADCLHKLYYAAVVREKTAGSAKTLYNHYIEAAFPFIEANNRKGLLMLIKQAAADFTAITDTSKQVPVIGLVGEIYVKYNSFSNMGVANWLIEKGVEVVPPCIINFFATTFVNSHINREQFIKKESRPLWMTDSLYRYVRFCMRRFDRVCAAFPFYRPFSNIFDDAKMASQVLNLAADFGEGWSLPGEVCQLAAHGVNNVVSLQPFGCIANHIISKGIEKKMKQLFSKMSLLFLDFDSSTSDANVFNRLHFMVENAKQQMPTY